MADPVGFPEITSTTAPSALKGAEVPGAAGLYDFNIIMKNSSKVTTSFLNRAIPTGSTITVKQLLSIFLKDIDGTTDISPPVPGPIKIAKFSTGFTLQDAQVNGAGQAQFTFLNTGIKGTADSQVAFIQLSGAFGGGERRLGSTTSGGTVTFFFALK